MTEGFSATVTPAAVRISTFSDALSPKAEMIAPGMAHRAALGRGQARDVGDDRLGHVVLDVGGGFGLLRAADFADHADDMGVGVGLEPFQDVAEGGAVDRVAADADRGGDADAAVLQLLGGLIAEGARAADDADVARQVDMARA